MIAARKNTVDNQLPTKTTTRRHAWRRSLPSTPGELAAGEWASFSELARRAVGAHSVERERSTICPCSGGCL
jgi:hypothetical protein